MFISTRQENIEMLGPIYPNPVIIHLRLKYNAFPSSTGRFFTLSLLWDTRIVCFTPRPTCIFVSSFSDCCCLVLLVDLLDLLTKVKNTSGCLSVPRYEQHFTSSRSRFYKTCWQISSQYQKKLQHCKTSQQPTVVFIRLSPKVADLTVGKFQICDSLTYDSQMPV